MNWISNATDGTDAKAGTIFTLKDTEVKIHHFSGCGAMWFLSYRPLEISRHKLGTEDFEEAKKKARDYILDQFARIFARVKIATDVLNASMEEPDRFSRY